MYWELNSGPLEEQPVLVTTEPPLHPPLKSLLTVKMSHGKFFLICSYKNPDFLSSDLNLAVSDLSIYLVFSLGIV